MRRFHALAFAALVVATLGAFFLTQHLKVTSSLIADFEPVPPSINPVHGGICEVHGEPISFKQTRIRFYLPFHSDDVQVSVLRTDGQTVHTFPWRSMTVGRSSTFVWNGRDQAGHVVDGKFYVNVALQHQGRTLSQTSPEIHVYPHALTASVETVKGPAADGTFTVHINLKHYRRLDLLIYRREPSGSLTLVDTVQVAGTSGGVATWNGQIGNQPAPGGSYLIGLRLADVACATSTFPATNPASAADVKHAGITISYVTVTPRQQSASAGTEATFDVDTRGVPYSWRLRRVSNGRVVASGRRGGSGTTLKIRLPDQTSAPYRLTIKAGGHNRTVSVLASASRGAARTRH